MNNAGLKTWTGCDVWVCLLAVRQEDDAKDLVQDMFLNAFRELKGGQLKMPPSHATREDSPTPYNDSILAVSNHHVSRLPGLFSHFHQPAIAAFAFIDSLSIDVNFCVGSM